MTRLNDLRQYERQAKVITLLLEEVEEDVKTSTPPEQIITALIFEANLLQASLENEILNFSEE